MKKLLGEKQFDYLHAGILVALITLLGYLYIPSGLDGFIIMMTGPIVSSTIVYLDTRNYGKGVNMGLLAFSLGPMVNILSFVFLDMLGVLDMRGLGGLVSYAYTVFIAVFAALIVFFKHISTYEN